MDDAKTQALLKLLRGRSLGSMSHADLYAARGQTKDPALQEAIGPAEHAAFAREATAENPLMALPIALATPIYTGAKAAGLIKARTPASWAEIGAGWTGTAEGLAQALRKRLKPQE